MKKLLVLIKHDIKGGTRYNIKKILFVILLFVVFCTDFHSQYLGHSVRENVFSQPTVCDYMLYIFRGMKEFDPALREAFSIPAAWLSIQLGIAYLVGNYPVRDMEGYGLQYLIRSGSKRLWLFSKCIYSAISTIQFYLVGYVVIMLWSVLFGSFEFSLNQDICANISNINTEDVTAVTFIICVIILPVLTSIAISILQTILMLFVRSMLSYLSVVVIASASAYYKTYLLPLNYSMIFRMLPINIEGLDQFAAMTIDIVLIIILIAIGSLAIRKFDFLEKRV